MGDAADNTFATRQVAAWCVAVMFVLATRGDLWGAAWIGVAQVDSVQVHGRVLTRAALVVGLYTGVGVPVMGSTWYRDRDVVRFHFYNDNRAYLQLDKFGHAFGAYVQSSVGYHWLRKTGATRAGAILYGGTWGVLLQAPIELMDGFHEGYGFSWGDVAANMLGSGLVVGQALLYDEQVVRYKFSYAPSRYARMANGYLGTSALSRVLEDYNAHTYWLSIPIRRLVSNDALPAWLAVAVGYGANGMIGEVENIASYRGVEIPPTDRYRQYYLSLDVDWSGVDVRSKWLRAILNGLNFVKVPFPGIEMTSAGRVRTCWKCG